MSLIPNEPYRMLDPFWNEMDRVLRRGKESFTDGLYRIDVEETQKKVIVTAEIPGIEKPEDLRITLNENQLMIQGEIRKIIHEEDDESVSRHSERYFGKFSRVLTLPALVKTDGAHASYRNGLLKLSFLKDAHPAARRIEVDFH
ncbi:Hsp20/alpha crystallin family protein [Desulfosporosinus nitroreducens]|uniref:Hsp20/alpha crystallin family protein n=1 Tax=Desulfosporosinus nitroreducens TaxID=2018668 RepID=A0ABT8QTZ5_9FIRM|nr:Hsp20/alpha crystallin family protein [Desulfosporosinus nitroreducens]MCO1601773.1 Hsp20/alpha crystallin family protein [Desulfosporosinus nitroreducens]MDO0824842.1 Hsp20/alpha crystallin family protein [Desulfosporosinus nitroreducens]